MKEIVLIIVAHSDDETIGMGSTIKKHIKKGEEVIVISMTNGVGSRANSSLENLNKRKKASINASIELGFTWGNCYDFEDNKLDNYPLLEIVKCLENAKNNYKPSVVYTHSGADLNIDHRILSNAVITAFRPQPNESCKEIRLFEIPSATDYGISNITGVFSPNLSRD